MERKDSNPEAEPPTRRQGISPRKRVRFPLDDKIMKGKDLSIQEIGLGIHGTVINITASSWGRIFPSCICTSIFNVAPDMKDVFQIGPLLQDSNLGPIFLPVSGPGRKGSNLLNFSALIFSQLIATGGKTHGYNPASCGGR